MLSSAEAGKVPDARLQWAACPACGGAEVIRELRIPDHEYGLSHIASYAECAVCGSVYQTPMPDAALLASFYPQDYHSFAQSSRLMEVRTNMRVARLARFLDRPGAVLDYGCGGGAFLRKAAQRFPDREFFGYEIAETDRVERLADGRVTIFRGDERELFAAVPKFQVAVLNHVIEHLPSPRETLTAIFKNLGSGGYIDGQTPATDSFDRALFKSAWSGYHAPRHTVVFSRIGLRSLLAASGFDDIKLSAAFNPGGIAMSLGALAHNKHPGRVARKGIEFLARMCAATGFSVLDYFSTRPGIVDFSARRRG